MGPEASTATVSWLPTTYMWSKRFPGCIRCWYRPAAGVRDRASGRLLSPWPRHRAGDCLGDDGITRVDEARRVLGHEAVGKCGKSGILAAGGVARNRVASVACAARCQAVLAIQWLWSLSRLWVAVD